MTRLYPQQGRRTHLATRTEQLDETLGPPVSAAPTPITAGNRLRSTDPRR